MTDVTAPDVTVERAGSLAVLRLNRPHRLNAMSRGLLDGLNAEIPRLLASSDVRVIMITGAGRAFCAGIDVGDLGPPDPERTLQNMRTCHERLKAIRSSEKFIVTAVNGPAAGGGFGLAMIGDLVLASGAAFFKAGFTDLGVAADYGLGFTLPRCVGPVRAAEIMFGERRIQAAEALAMGFVGRVFPAETFEADALAYARRLSEAPAAAHLTKDLLRHGEAEAFAAFLEAEARAQIAAFNSRDYGEGIAAFREKRTAVFEGR